MRGSAPLWIASRTGAGDCEHPSAPYPPKSSDPKRRGAASSRSARCVSPAGGETPNGVNWNREGRPTEELGASRPGSQHERAGRPSSLAPSPVRLRPRLPPGRSPSTSEAAPSSCWESCLQRAASGAQSRQINAARVASVCARDAQAKEQVASRHLSVRAVSLGGRTPPAPPNTSTSPQLCSC